MPGSDQSKLPSNVPADEARLLGDLLCEGDSAGRLTPLTARSLRRKCRETLSEVRDFLARASLIEGVRPSRSARSTRALAFSKTLMVFGCKNPNLSMGWTA